VFKALREFSIKNPGADSKSMTLGKYDDGGPTSYIAKAGKNSTYFDMGKVLWGRVQEEYNLTDAEMFEYFNKPALNDAIKQGKIFRFSHNPLDYYGSFLSEEWEYLKDKLILTDENLIFEGGFWYVKQ